MGQHLATHTELWGLHYHRLGCIHKVLVCNCLQKLFKHVQPCKLPFNNSFFLSKVCSLARKKMLTHSFLCMRFRFVHLCICVCELQLCVLWVFETLTATGTAAIDWLHNLVCSLC